MIEQCSLCSKLLQAAMLCCKQHISGCYDKLAGEIPLRNNIYIILACFGYADDRHLV